MKFTHETWRRAARTFIQAALSYVLVNLVTIDFTLERGLLKTALIGLGVSSLAAGIAAVMNIEIPYFDEGSD